MGESANNLPGRPSLVLFFSVTTPASVDSVTIPSLQLAYNSVEELLTASGPDSIALDVRSLFQLFYALFAPNDIPIDFYTEQYGFPNSRGTPVSQYPGRAADTAFCYRDPGLGIVNPSKVQRVTILFSLSFLVSDHASAFLTALAAADRYTDFAS